MALLNGWWSAHDCQPGLIIGPICFCCCSRLQGLSQDLNWKRGNTPMSVLSKWRGRKQLPRSLTNKACLISSRFKFSRFPLLVLLLVVVAVLAVVVTFEAENDDEAWAVAPLVVVVVVVADVPPLFDVLLCLILRRIISIRSQMDVSCTSSSTSALWMNSLISLPPRISAAKSFRGIC